MDTLDLIDRLECGDATPADMTAALDLAAKASEDDLLTVDPFQGDYEETFVLSDKFVAGRQEYEDHMTGMPIVKGERHRCLRERGEDGIITTRHSKLSLWICLEGGDPYSLRATHTDPGTREQEAGR